MRPNKVAALLGLATKAGRLVSGEFMTEKAVKTGEAFLVIVSEEASNNTKKMFRNMCSFYSVPMYCYGTKDELGHCIGKEFRASMAVTEEGFAKSCIRLSAITFATSVLTGVVAALSR